jgi:hypothetical protein
LREGTFTTIDLPDGVETGYRAGVVGINSRDVVGAYRAEPATLACGCDGYRAFVFRHGSYSTFDFPGAISTFYNGINRRGDIVGGYLDASGRPHGFLARKPPKE